MMSTMKWAVTNHLSGRGLVHVQPLKEFYSKSSFGGWCCYFDYI